MQTDADDGSVPRVYLDVMLGSLATILRMAGWDAAYALDEGIEDDADVLAAATADDRVLLTRDRQLAARTPHSLLLTSRSTEGQVAELRSAGFIVSFDAPTRCSACNSRLEPVDGGVATPEGVPDPSETRVWRCSECGQHFWKGSHWDDVVARLGDGDPSAV